jgi:hypothetical protein
MAGGILEEAWTGVDGGKSSSLDSSVSFTAARVGGSIPLRPVATTGLLLEAINAEFAMAPRV